MTKCKFRKTDGRCKNKSAVGYDGYCKRHYDMVNKQSPSHEEERPIEEVELQDLPPLDLSDDQNTDNQQTEVHDVAIEPILESQEPIVDEPLEEPVAEELIVEEIVDGEEPVAEEPVAEEPVAEEPVAQEPVAQEIVVAEEPVAEEPVAEEPVAEEPVAEEPVAEEPIVEEPIAEEVVYVDEPVVEDPNTNVMVEMDDPYTVPINQSLTEEERVRDEQDTYDSLREYQVTVFKPSEEGFTDNPLLFEDNENREEEPAKPRKLSTTASASKARGHRSQIKLPDPKSILKLEKGTERQAKKVRFAFDESVKPKRASPQTAERFAKVTGLEVTVVAQQDVQPESVVKEEKAEETQQQEEVEEEIPKASATSDWVLSQADRKKILSLLTLLQASKKAGASAVFVPDYKEAIRLAHSRDGYLLLNSFVAGNLEQWVGNFHNRTFNLTDSLSVKMMGAKSAELIRHKLALTHDQLTSYAASLEEFNAMLVNEPRFVFYVASHPLHWRPEESEGTGKLGRYLWCTTSVKDAVNKANSCERHWKPVLVIIRLMSGKHCIPFAEPGTRKGKLLLLPQYNVRWVSSRPHQSKPGETSHRIFEADPNVVAPHVSLYKLTLSE